MAGTLPSLAAGRALTQAAPPPAVRLVATDLDGTLLGSDHTLGARDAQALRRLGRAGVIRVVATGRSLRAAERVLDRSVPVDYLVVSSGAGILDFGTGELLARHGFDAPHAERVAEVLLGLGLDFMVHALVPDDHHFRYSCARTANPDFERRVGRNGRFAVPWDGAAPLPEASQFVAILRPGEAGTFERTRAALAGFSVTRSTSPLDGRSIWLEVRPAGVGKAEAVAWLAARHRLEAAQTAAVGNDYNDLGLLRWSGHAFVVGNAAPELRERHRVVSSNDAGGFSDVVTALSRTEGGLAPAAAPAAGRGISSPRRGASCPP